MSLPLYLFIVEKFSTGRFQAKILSPRRQGTPHKGKDKNPFRIAPPLYYSTADRETPIQMINEQ